MAAAHLIDLSYPISMHMPRWQVQFETKQLGYGHRSSTIGMNVHTGTHLDSPSHFIHGAAGIDAFPLDLAVSEALIIDLTDVQPNQCVTAADLAARFPAAYPSTILLRSDWWRRAWDTARFWPDAPFLDEEAGKWLAAKEIRLIGYDFPQETAIKRSVLGFVEEQEYVVHQAILGEGIWQMEYLTNLHAIGSSRCTLYVLPLRLAGLEASPVRVMASPLP